MLGSSQHAGAGEASAAIFMLSLVTDVWNQLQISADIEGSPEFFRVTTLTLTLSEGFVCNKSRHVD